jgi:hypothetical protein
MAKSAATLAGDVAGLIGLSCFRSSGAAAISRWRRLVGGFGALVGRDGFVFRLDQDQSDVERDGLSDADKSIRRTS